MKKITNCFSCVLLLLCAGVVVSSCESADPLGPGGDGGKESIPVSFLTLSETEIELEVGEIHILECIISPYNADNQSVIWTTSDKSVATVKDGVVTAIKAGSAIVTATADDNGKMSNCTVTVTGDEGNNNGGDGPGTDMDLGVNLSMTGSANCYIITEAGKYSFKAVKGNSDELVEYIASAEVLWETFGTDQQPNVGDLVNEVSYSNGVITFTVSDKKGNAVIVAKDIVGTIRWSWHIWLTDQPEEQEYYNNAGIVMDRNLGATSATPGDVCALGLFYQWGRKDPFLGSLSINSEKTAKSTITCPSAVPSSANGTIEYATAHPTTFITNNSSNDDWYYTGYSDTDNTRWTTSDKSKSIYDPCPAGWRVPDGGKNGIWSKALGSSSSLQDESLYNGTNEGINFSGLFGSASNIWYPASGSLDGGDGSLSRVGSTAYYWSASPYTKTYAHYLYLDHDGRVHLSDGRDRAYGRSVRCVKE